MLINIHFEVATAVYLSYCTIVYFKQQHLEVMRSKYFKMLLIMVVLTTYVDVISTVLCHTVQPTYLQDLSEMLYLTSHMITLVIFSIYLFTLTGVIQFVDDYKYFYFVPAAVDILMIVSTPWTRVLFENTPKGYTFHFGMFVFVAISFVYLFIPLVYALLKKREIKKLNFKWIAFLIFMVVGNTALQAALPHSLRVSYVINGMCVYLCLIFIQNADFFYDDVTGLFKIQGMEEVLKEKMLNGQTCSLLLMRICNYSAMGEIYDDSRLAEIQKKIADSMKKHFPKETFYHISSSSFAVITDKPEKINIIYEELLKELPRVWKVRNEKIVHEYVFYHVNCPAECDDIEELMRRIYYARSDHQGHHASSTLIHLSHDTVKHAEEEQEIVDLLDRALMDNSLELRYQPIYSLHKDKITSLEVLARLKDNSKKYINPEQFIRVAENNQMILRIGEQIYRKACNFVKTQDLFSLGIEDININLSPLQCCYDGLTEELTMIASQYDIPMSRMHLEITESAIMNRNEIRKNLLKLSMAGANIALDDFGTGYASLTSIVSLHIDYVKIDKSLVWSYSEGENQFLNQLIPMLRSEGKKIIAEGIETKQQVEIFKKLQGDYLQGYYFSRPLSEMDFVRYVKKFNGIEQ